MPSTSPPLRWPRAWCTWARTTTTSTRSGFRRSGRVMTRLELRQHPMENRIWPALSYLRHRQRLATQRLATAAGPNLESCGPWTVPGLTCEPRAMWGEVVVDEVGTDCHAGSLLGDRSRFDCAGGGPVRPKHCARRARRSEH